MLFLGEFRVGGISKRMFVVGISRQNPSCVIFMLGEFRKECLREYSVIIIWLFSVLGFISINYKREKTKHTTRSSKLDLQQPAPQHIWVDFLMEGLHNVLLQQTLLLSIVYLQGSITLISVAEIREGKVSLGFRELIAKSLLKLGVPRHPSDYRQMVKTQIRFNIKHKVISTQHILLPLCLPIPPNSQGKTQITK